MDRLHGLTIFMNVVETRSLSATARALGVSPSAVSAAVARLEKQLEARLLNRTTRKLSPTPEGLELYERGKRIIAEIEEAERSISQAGRSPSGRLLIGMPSALGRMVIIPRLAEFTAALPSGLRRARPRQPSGQHRGRRAGCCDPGRRSLPLRTCWSASCIRRLRAVCRPGYLEEHGTPRAPADLAGHRRRLPPPRATDRSRQWRLQASPTSICPGAATPSRQQRRRGLTAAAASGLGIAQVALLRPAALRQRANLSRVLPQHRCHAHDISIVFPATIGPRRD